MYIAKPKIDREAVKQHLLRLIKEYNIYFFNYLACFVDINIKTLIKHRLHEDEDIMHALSENRAKSMVTMLDKWVKSDNPVLQLAAAKVIGDEHVRAALTNVKIDSDGNTPKKGILPEDLTVKKQSKKKK